MTNTPLMAVIEFASQIVKIFIARLMELDKEIYVMVTKMQRPDIAALN